MAARLKSRDKTFKLRTGYARVDRMFVEHVMDAVY